MSHTITIDIDPRHEAIVRRALALAQEMEQLALAAPDGTVFDACEQAVLEKGRTLQNQILAEAVARRIQDAEKKGRRCAAASAGVSSRTADPSGARC